MADDQVPEVDQDTNPQPVTGECRRCRQWQPLDDDGFCLACAKAMEQACL